MYWIGVSEVADRYKDLLTSPTLGDGNLVHYLSNLESRYATACFELAAAGEIVNCLEIFEGL